MGTPMAVNYASIFMEKFKKKHAKRISKEVPKVTIHMAPKH